MTANQMKYLLALIHQPQEGQNQSDVARIFKVHKSTVNRAVMEAIKQGILVDSDTVYKLTGYGRQYIKEYEERLEQISAWIKSQGIDAENARADSFAILESCSKQTVNMLQKKGKLANVYQKLEHSKNPEKLTSEDIEKYFGEGEYALPFAFYRKELDRSSKQKERQVSMANEAFYHPGTLCISKFGSYFSLGIKNVHKESKMNREKMVGKLKTMKYEVNNKEKIVMLNDEKVYIPIEVIRFYYIKEDNILRGYMEVTMSCTVGELHMPESRAVLVIYFE